MAAKASEVAEGTWAIRVPKPYGGHTVVYLLAEDEGFSLIDAGWGSREGLSALVAGIEQAGFSPDDLNGAAVTHHHQGHAGLLQAFRRPEVWCGIHGHELKTLKDIRDGKAPVSGFEVPIPSVPAGTVLLNEGAVLPLKGRTVRTMWTPGHTFGHVVFIEEHSEGTLLFSGDHLLPEDAGDAGGLLPGGAGGGAGRLGLDVGFASHAAAAYLDSLARTAELPADTLVLPGEGLPFRALRSRTDQITRQRRARTLSVAEAAQSMDSPSVQAIAEAAGAEGAEGSEGSFERFAALMDTAAHMYAAGVPVAALPTWSSR